jgi:hypothetical protein
MTRLANSNPQKEERAKPTKRHSSISPTLTMTLAFLGFILIWLVFSTFVVPYLINSAYHGKSLPIFNRMISGQSFHGVREYLSTWNLFRWRMLLDLSLLGLLAVLVTRPEFRKALWGSVPSTEKHSSQSAYEAFPVQSEGKTIPSQIGTHLIAFIAYLALAVIFTLPGSLHLGRTLLGDGADNYLHSWFLWDFAKSVVHGQNPFRTDLILYPFGANLAWASTDPLAGTLALPLSFFLGPVVIYNISVILQLTLAAFFARLLCLRISRHPAAAAIGGMIFGFSPFMLEHALGHLSVVTTFPIPLFVLALDQLLEKEKPSWKEGILLGLAVLLTALASYQYAVFCLMFIVVILGIDFGLERFGLVKRVWMPLLVGAATFLACFSPLLIMLLGSSGGLPKPQPIEIEWRQRYSADLLGFLVPSPHSSFLGQYVRKLPSQFFDSGHEGIVYTGVIALFLGAVGFWSAPGKQRRWAGRAMVAGILFAALSLGPTVHVLGKPTNLPAPASLLYKVEFFRFLREPGRLSVLTVLCLSLLASLGVAFLLNNLRRRWQKSLLLVMVAAGLMLEYVTFPFHTSSTVDPALFSEAPKTTQRCALPPYIKDRTVLTVPLFDWNHYHNAMWMQMMDGGRYTLVDGNVSPWVSNLLFDQTPIIRVLLKMPNDSAVAAPDRQFADALIQQLNLGAVVVFDAAERPAEMAYVRQVFDAKENIVGTCAVFEIEAKSTSSGPKK